MFDSAATKANKAAAAIRQELYQRIDRKMNKLKSLFQQVKPDIKKIIREASASELVELMDQGKITSLETVLTFIERAATIGLRNNYVIDQMFEQAINQAKQYDGIRRQNKHKRCWKLRDELEECFPPFFGVPISLKEVILYKDKITYVGHVYPTNPIPKEHPLIVEILLRMGFIPFVRTNVPPTCKIFETVNRIFDYTENPWVKGRSCGGSSGGEGGIVAAGCSPIGIGTDIGGSCRIPAEWTGLCTLKHGHRYTRMGNAFYGKYAAGFHIKSQISPLTKSVEDLVLFSQFIFDPKNYSDIPLRKHDIYIKQSPFDNTSFERKSKLTIGYQKSINNQYRCSPAHERVLDEAVAILQKRGHTLKQIEVPYLSEVFQYFASCLAGDSQITAIKELTKGEPPIKQYKLFFISQLIPWLVRYILIWFLKKKAPRFARLISLTKPRTASEIIVATHQNAKVRERKIFKFLADENIDVWLMPGFPLPAIRHGNAGKYNLLVGHTAVWNALHYPAGMVPIDLIRRDETEFQDSYNDMLTRQMKAEIKDSEGLPVGVQVISYPTNDQQVLYVMSEIQAETKFRQKHCCPVVQQEVNI